MRLYHPRMRKLLGSLMVLLVCGCGMVSAAVPEDASRYERARFFYEQGIIFEAIKELELHVERHREDVAAHVFLGELLSEVGLDARAAAVMTHVLDLDPSDSAAERQLTRMRNNLARRVDRSDPGAVLEFARIAARPGSYERAAVFYRLALALQDSTSVHLEFARMLSWAAAFDESAHHYKIVLERNPGALPVKREAGRVFNAQGDFLRAIEVLSRYTERRPGDTGALLDLIWAHIWAGQEREGERLLREIIREEPDRIDILLVRGALAEREGRILDAYQYYRRALDADPEHADAMMRMEALDQGNRLAIARLQEKVSADPQDVDSHITLAETLIEEERFGEAIALLEGANRRLPGNERIYTTLRNLRARDHQRVQERLDIYRTARAARQSEQIETLRTWVEENPQDVRTRMELIQILFDGGLYAEAEEELLEMQDQGPMNPVAFEMLNLITTRKAERELQEGIREGRLLQ